MIKQSEGFPHERLMRLPEEMLKHALALPVCEDITVTDLGHFAEATGHEVRRPEGVNRPIVILCVSGEGWCELGEDERRRVPAGSLVVLPAGTPHAYGASAGNPWRIYWVHFTGLRAESYVHLLRGNGMGPVFGISGLEEICEGFETLWRNREEGGAEPGLMRMSAEGSRLLVLMHAHVRGSGEVPQVNGERVERALDRMREGVAEELNLVDFAKAAGVSVPHFCVVFKARTGVPPMLYFTRLRMRHAAELLDSSDATVEEIGCRVGYPNPFHFSRAFRRTQGMSPRAYRQRLRG